MPARTRSRSRGHGHKPQLSDPLAHALQPPANESPSQRTARVAREAEEKRVSNQIDDALARERAERRKVAKREVKVLLLGQSESGKSTVLKNFRLKYAPQEWKKELRSWRTVIQLNLIQNVITILDALAPFLDPPSSSPPNSPTTPNSPTDALAPRPPQNKNHDGHGGHGDREETEPEVLTQAQRLLHMRLSPLRGVSDDLRRRLGAADPEFSFAASSSSSASPSSYGHNHNNDDHTTALSSSPSSSFILDLPPPQAQGPREFAVRGWIGALGLANSSSTSNSQKRNAGEESGGEEGGEEVDPATEVLATLSEDIAALWADAGVRRVLQRERVRVEDWAGFFLPDTPRIASRSYVPTDNDVVRARLRTMGVQEWRVCLEGGEHFGAEWVLYDVGGARSMRHAWLPYFDTVNAIIFLAPLSPFDERLSEDPSVNRLQDTLLLWRALVASPLIGKGVALVVFLNKCDLLKRKLESGVRLNTHLISFGDRPNEVGAVVKYVKDKFKDILRAESAHARPTYLYATSVTDTKATATTLGIVRDGILREHLKNAEFV
ncbi:guanine nucleotide binding protein, alpha subunit [Mycena filopes]|nr:guanine nucleotide binding protein, alpha subunit [Mycena filopes]